MSDDQTKMWKNVKQNVLDIEKTFKNYFLNNFWIKDGAPARATSTARTLPPFLLTTNVKKCLKILQATFSKHFFETFQLIEPNRLGRTQI